MWKKRLISATAVLAGLVTISSSLIYAKDNTLCWKKFYNETGKTVYYQTYGTDDHDVDGQAGKRNKYTAPETAEIGDIFQYEDGYERVFAVSEDGAYMTEKYSTYEEAYNAGK